MKHLTSLTPSEKKAFLSSFDHVFCDVDGVLWHLNHKEIPGAREALTHLKSLKKKILYVSNNSSKCQNTYTTQLKTAGYDLHHDDLVRPILALIHHLKKIKFSKKIYVIGMGVLRKELMEAGFEVVTFHFDNPEDSLPLYVKNALVKDVEIGAVVVDFDVNLQVIQLQKAATYLRDAEVLFFTLGPDRRLLFGDDVVIIGPGVYYEILEDISGRKASCFGKPSALYGGFIKEKFGIDDASRVLFIGDSVPQDMAFATNCGFKKLLVLSGLTPDEAVEDWKFEEEHKPEFYVKSLGELKDFF